MPTKNVVIQGTMTYADEPGDSGARPEHPIHYPPVISGGPGSLPPYPSNELPRPPLGIWGPTDPRPGWGLPTPPPGIWGPGSGFPTPPIHIPGDGGGTGIWGPTDPRPGYGPVGPQPPTGGQGGQVTPPAAGVPIKGSLVWVERFGYVFIPESAARPDNTLPPVEGGEGGEQPSEPPDPDDEKRKGLFR